MDRIQLSVVHRLPQSYRWLSGFRGIKVESVPMNSIDEDNYLIGLKLLSYTGCDALQIMQQLNRSLQEIQVECAIAEWEGEPCLFVYHYDESAAMCRIKNMGAAIAEDLNGNHF